MISVFKENIKHFISIIHWVLWWFITTNLIIILIVVSYFFPKRWWDVLVKISCTIMMASALIFPRIKGYPLRNLPFPVIFIANHVSFFDLFIAGSVLPGYPRGIELYSHFLTPIYGWFITRFGQISIQKGNNASIRKALKSTIDLLINKRRNIYIAPEGTRTIDGNIGKFLTGGFFLSFKTKTPVVPVVYRKLFDRNNKNNFLINPGLFEVIILAPIYPEKFKDADEMGFYIREIMQKKLIKGDLN